MRLADLITPEEIAAFSRKVASEIGAMLGQEYRWLQGRNAGRWWLYSLGEPQRPLTETEVKEAGLPDRPQEPA